MLKIIIAIDPGAHGAIAVYYNDGRVGRVECHRIVDDGDTLNFLVSQSMARAHGLGIMAYVENVGQYHPGNSGPASVKFAEHCGFLRGVLFALAIPREKVSPATWMKALGTLPKNKAARKRAIKVEMAQRYPHLDVTLVNADALGILTWAMKQ